MLPSASITSKVKAKFPPGSPFLWLYTTCPGERDRRKEVVYYRQLHLIPSLEPGWHCKSRDLQLLDLGFITFSLYFFLSCWERFFNTSLVMCFSSTITTLSSYFFPSPFPASNHPSPLKKIWPLFTCHDYLKAGILTFIYISLGETFDRSFDRDLDWIISVSQLQTAHAGVLLHDKSDHCVIWIRSCCFQVLSCEVCCRAWARERKSSQTASANPAECLDWTW